MSCAPRSGPLIPWLPQCRGCSLRCKMVESIRRTILRGVAGESTLLDRCLHLPWFWSVRDIPEAVEHARLHWDHHGGCWIRPVGACTGSAWEVFCLPSAGQGTCNDGPLLQISPSHLSLRWNSLSWFVYRLGQTVSVTMLAFVLSATANPAGKKRGTGLGTGIWGRISPVQGQHMVLSRLLGEMGKELRVPGGIMQTSRR